MKITVAFGTSEDLQPMIDLDYDIYPVEGIVTTESVIERFNKDNYQYLVAKDEHNNLQGYLNIVSMPDHAFNKIVEGNWSESEELVADNILSLTSNTEINCYITSIIVRDYNSEVAQQLLYGLLKYARLLSHKHITINKIAAIAFSREGENLCKKLAFEPMKRLEQLNCGFVPIVYLLDFKKENPSYLIQKIQKISSAK